MARLKLASYISLKLKIIDFKKSNVLVVVPIVFSQLNFESTRLAHFFFCSHSGIV